MRIKLVAADCRFHWNVDYLIPPPARNSVLINVRPTESGVNQRFNIITIGVISYPITQFLIVILPVFRRVHTQFSGHTYKYRQLKGSQRQFDFFFLYLAVKSHLIVGRRTFCQTPWWTAHTHTLNSQSDPARMSHVESFTQNKESTRWEKQAERTDCGNKLALFIR